jgi:AcrR family transcriptional regulator
MAKTGTSSERLQQLPRGRHGLPREAVAESQRSRILEAMVEVTAERGYAECQIAHVIAYAGVSRKTFYELFSDKEDCFLAAYELWLGRLLSTTAEAYESGAREAWVDGIQEGLAAFLDFIAQHPAPARFCIVEVLAAGPRALARRDAGIRQFTYLIDAGRAETSAQLPGITALAVVGGIHELLYSEIIHGATAQLPGRLPELVFWIVQPFLGGERAAEERDRARELAAERAAAGASVTG